MFFTFIKILITALIIVIAAEVAKRSSLLAGLIVSMPLITILTLMWLYLDTKDIKQVSELTNNTLLMIVPSLTFFVFFTNIIKNWFKFFTFNDNFNYRDNYLLLDIHFNFK